MDTLIFFASGPLLRPVMPGCGPVYVQSVPNACCITTHGWNRYKLLVAKSNAKGAKVCRLEKAREGTFGRAILSE